jgi:hypothetical protein
MTKDCSDSRCDKYTLHPKKTEAKCIWFDVCEKKSKERKYSSKIN